MLTSGLSFSSKCSAHFIIIFLSFEFLFIYVFKCLFLFEREREKAPMWGRGRERGDTLSEAGSRLRAVSAEPHAGLEPTNREIVTGAEVGRSTG